LHIKGTKADNEMQEENTKVAEKCTNNIHTGEKKKKRGLKEGN
jgi:hypothetical protein